jgi:hypothetical protein
MEYELNSTHYYNYITATQLFNYFLDDTLLDYLDLNGTQMGLVQDECPFATQTILNKGHIFEDKVIHKIIDKNITVVKVAEFSDWNEGANETLRLMREGVPIIYQGYLINNNNQTRGRPDILIRANFLNQLKDGIITDDDIKMRSNLSNDTERWHYRVIDIKMSNICLTGNGERILNNKLYKAYKAQVLVYNTALGLLQDYQPECGYLLGRSSHNYNNTITYDDCFSSIAVIDYSLEDNEFINHLDKALKWYRLLKVLPIVKKDLNTNKYNWEVIELFLPDDYKFCLKPNMKNKYNYKWVTAVKEISTERQELTLLWNCGVSKRNKLLNQGVKNWDDYKNYCKTKDNFTNQILFSILDINSPSNQNNYLPKKLDIEFLNFIPPIGKPFVVLDFETINNLNDEFDDLPEKGGEELIFLIGITIVIPVLDESTKKYKNEYRYFPFMTENLHPDDEFRIVVKMLSLVRDLLEWLKLDDITFYHWSQAETTFFNNMIDRQWEYFDELDKKTFDNIKFNDVLSIFKYNPIVVKGAYNFSLKTIGTALFNLGLIKSSWNNHNQKNENGFSVMLKMNEYNKEAIKLKMNLTDFKEVNDVIHYNMVDCNVLAEIITFLQDSYLS